MARKCGANVFVQFYRGRLLRGSAFKNVPLLVKIKRSVSNASARSPKSGVDCVFLYGLGIIFEDRIYCCGGAGRA